MSRTIIAAAMVAASAAPASAGHVWLNGWDTNYSSGAGRIFTDGTINVRVSAWSIDDSGTIHDADLDVWSYGLGIENGPNDNSHTIDNSGWSDFLVFQFDQTVELDNALFASSRYWGPHDTDATIGYGMTALDYTSQPTVGDLSFTEIYGSSSSSGWDWDSGYVDFNYRDINPDNNIGNFWLIGASFDSPQRYYDGFKLKKITYDIAPPAVPEPATWLMMILGFGLVGGVMRGEKRKDAPALV